MSDVMNTGRRLAELNDAAAFEHIAAAVLRAADPLLYANVVHPGVQPGGKTVKALFDNVGWSNSAAGKRLVCAAHTTEQNDLRGKWLHDPTKVKTRKPGGKPTKPAGDLIKGIEAIQILRESMPDLAVTYALTTNLEPSFDLLMEVERLAVASGIDVVVWSVSKIAHFLDCDPVGQIIRRNRLGIPVKLLSREMLLEVGKRSIADHVPMALDPTVIRREDLRLGLNDTLVIGASGMGKTTLCVTALAAYLDSGLPVLVLKPEMILPAATVAVAIEAELRRQQPELEVGAGARALSFCTESEPLLLLVEDVNRTDNPGLLLNKILSWTLAPGRTWRLICPVWPRYLDSIEDQKRVLARVSTLTVDRYVSEHAVQAIQKRVMSLGLTFDPHRARDLAERLGFDPLLIGLCDLTAEDTTGDVIEFYVMERLGIAAARAQHSRSEVLESLHSLMRGMLERRTLTAEWGEVKSWLSAPEIALLRQLTNDANVIRLRSSGGKEIIDFRHDRVMYFLFSIVIADVLVESSVPDYVTDPFFSEVVASAVLRVKLPLNQMIVLSAEAPLIAAYALKLATEAGDGYADVAARAVGEWLNQAHVQSESYSNQRYALANILSRITSPQIANVLSHFREADLSWMPVLAAAFRNGNLGAGLGLLSMLDLGTNFAGKESLLAIVKSTYGSRLIPVIAGILGREDISTAGQARTRNSALLLAGYLGDSAFATAVQQCWQFDQDRNDNLDTYLFVAARCCGSETDATLGPICDAWEQLLGAEDPDQESSECKVDVDPISWEFRIYPPDDAIAYLVARAQASDVLRWRMFYMLRTVDHPDLLESLVRYAAGLEFAGKHFLQSEWEPRAHRSLRRMSPESKARLLQVACDENEPVAVRKEAFSYWRMDVDGLDLSVAREIAVGSPLHEQAMWARIHRGDIAVIPEVLELLPDHPAYWLQVGQYVWCDALTEALNPLLDQIADSSATGSNLEYAVADALWNVEPQRRLKMLSERWEQLKTKPKLVQVVLLTTSPEASDLAREAFASSPEPGLLLRSFIFSITCIQNGRIKLDSPKLLQNFIPYLDFFSEDNIVSLWDKCTEMGWVDFRLQHLDNRAQRAANCRPHPVDIEALDLALEDRLNKGLSLHKWLERNVQWGRPRTEVIVILFDWFERNGCSRAVFVVGEVISAEATRPEFLLFEEIVKDKPELSEYLRSVRFDVFSRTLV